MRLRDVLWIIEDLRDWSRIDWKPRLCANYSRQVQMDHILIWFLLLLSLLNLHWCLHKKRCVFDFLGIIISPLVFHSSYYWLIIAVYYFHYLFASVCWWQSLLHGFTFVRKFSDVPFFPYLSFFSNVFQWPFAFDILLVILLFFSSADITWNVSYSIFLSDV